jgi:hypothetical protein
MERGEKCVRARRKMRCEKGLTRAPARRIIKIKDCRFVTAVYSTIYFRTEPSVVKTWRFLFVLPAFQPVDQPNCG